MPGKRSAHERLPELIAAAVRVFTRDGYRAARMSDVAAEVGLSEAALYRYVDSKEGLFVLAIRHALLLEDLPGGELPLSPAPASLVLETLDWVARRRFSDPYGSAITAEMAEETVVDMLVHALVPPHRQAVAGG